MSDFLEQLRIRRTKAAEVLEETKLRAKKMVDDAEADFYLWDTAIHKEEMALNPTTLVSVDNGVVAVSNTIPLTLDSIRRRSGIVLKTMESVGRPISRKELVDLVAPAVSRASVYTWVKDGIEEGFLREDGGMISLAKQQ